MNRVPEKVALALALTAFENGMFYERHKRLPNKDEMKETYIDTLPEDVQSHVKGGFQFTLDFICEGLDK